MMTKSVAGLGLFLSGVCAVSSVSMDARAAVTDCISSYQLNLKHNVALTAKRGFISTTVGAATGVIAGAMNAEGGRSTPSENVQVGVVTGGALMLSTTVYAAKEMTTETSASTSQTTKRKGYELALRILTQADQSYATGPDLDAFTKGLQTKLGDAVTSDDVVKELREFNAKACPLGDSYAGMSSHDVPSYEGFAARIQSAVCSAKKIYPCGTP